MEEQIFEFRGFAFKTLVAGAIVGSLLGITIFFVLNSFISLDHPGFMLIIAVPICLIVLAIWSKFFINFWRVRVVGNFAEICKDEKFYFSFEFSAIKKLQIHGFGWHYEVLPAETSKKTSSAAPFYVGIYLFLENFWKNKNKNAQALSRDFKIKTNEKKFRLMLDTGQFAHATSIKEIKAFDEFFAILENYAIAQKYEKINLTRENWTPKHIRKYRYVKKEK